MKRLIAIGLFIFVPSVSWGTIALVNANAHAAGCASTVASTTSGNLLVVFCESQSGTPTASVSDDASGGSNTYVEVPASRGSISGGVATSNIFYSQSIHGGATTITCSGACYGSSMYEYSGALASGDPVDVSTGSLQISCVGTVGTCNTLPNTTDAGDLIFANGIPGVTMTGVAAPYGNFESDANGSGTADYIPGSTLSGHATVWTCTNGDFFACGTVAFKPAAGAAVTSSPTQLNILGGKMVIQGGKVNVR